MARSLLSIGGLYFTAGAAEASSGAWGVSSAKKGIGGTWTVMDNTPDVISCMTLSPGVMLASVGSGFTIPITEIAGIETCEGAKRGKKTAVRLTMRDGAIHIMDVKKENKADAAVASLTALLHR